MADRLPSPEELRAVLHEGDPERVRALIASGANFRYRRDHGYDALIDAVHGRDVHGDPRLLELLQVLVANRVPLSGHSKYGESGVRVLSHLGRFDAVELLLEAGSDPKPLGWTPLIRAVAIGSLADVDRELDAGAALEARDCWERTAWLVALLKGDRAKAERLERHGADTHARGRCDKPPLFYAIAGRHPDLLRWLLERGQDVDQTDQFEYTPLLTAIEEGHVECLEILLAAGADLAHGKNGDAVWHATDKRGPASAVILQRLFDAGANRGELTHEGHRILLGLPESSEAGLEALGRDAFLAGAKPSFGTANPERQSDPFREAMIRSGATASQARARFDPASDGCDGAIWCAHRFGQSITFLADGRVIQVAGEHEDHYDRDFQIYNDVFVRHPDGSIEVYGYPEDVFPATDFHSATLVGDHLVLIGSLGYPQQRRAGHTPVFRLHTRTYGIERLEVPGVSPGWISQHRATLVGPHEIRVDRGAVQDPADEGARVFMARPWILDLSVPAWRLA